MTGAKLLVHTDVVLDYLVHSGEDAHPLRRAMRSQFCYTTVFNAVELFSLAGDADERAAIGQALAAMKILGLNARLAPEFGARLQTTAPLPRMNGLIACLSIASRLPILTGRPEEFAGMDGLTLVPLSAV